MDYHVLRKAVDNTTCHVAVHLATPSGINAAGKPWSNLLVDVDGQITTVPHHKTSFPVENKELVKGQICEISITFEFSDPGLNNGQRRQEIRDRVTQMKLDIQDEESDLFKEKFGPYDWYLYAEDVPGE